MLSLMFTLERDSIAVISLGLYILPVSMYVLFGKVATVKWYL